jgi:hypothetical protein
MKLKWNLLAVALIAGGTMFAQPRVAIGIGVGGYGPGAYPPPAYAQQYVPPCPGPGYTWVDGYYGPQGWVAGFWQAPYVNTYVGGYVAPRYVAPRYDRDDFRHVDRDDHARTFVGREQGRVVEHHDSRGNSFRR